MIDISITNDGPAILASDYWQSDLARAGKYLISPNDGVIRCLLPEAYHAVLPEIAACPYAIATRGQWQGQDGLEILWEDHTDSPHAWHMTAASCLLLPGDPAPGAWQIACWIERDGHPYRALQLPCKWRAVPTLPLLKPWCAS